MAIKPQGSLLLDAMAEYANADDADNGGSIDDCGLLDPFIAATAAAMADADGAPEGGYSVDAADGADEGTNELAP